MYTTYGNYTTTTTAANAGDLGAMAAGIMATFGVMIVIAIAFAVVALVAKYKVFKKMGIDGWKSLIPMVSDYCQMEATGVNQKWLLVATFGSFIMIIPILGYLAFIVAMLYMAILMNVSLARAFGKSTGFAVGLILLGPIFLCILAFSKDAKFEGKNPMNDMIFKK